MAESRYYFVQDVMVLLELKERKAYDIIRALNEELKAMGKITIPGRINKTYFHHRVDVDIEEIRKEEIAPKQRSGQQ